MHRFDDLTRRLSGAGSSRRQALRTLGSMLRGGALGGVAARLGLAEVATAKSRKRRAKPKRKRPSQTERKAQGHLQAEGKRKGKKGNKKPKRPSRPDLVCSNGKPKCPDGSCVPFGECCPGYYRCGDGFCVKDNACCPDKWQCEDGSCVAQDACCANERRCSDGSCVSLGACCPGEKLCPNGTCLKNERCCADTVPVCTGCDDPVCASGEWECRTTCEDGEECCGGQCLPTCTNGCERTESCGPCGAAPGGMRYCPPQHICVPHCSAGQWLDVETCACVNPCPNGHPETCDGLHPEFDYVCPGGLYACRCQQTTKGTTHCVSNIASVSCTKDADCDLWYGSALAGKVVCDACDRRCRVSGCPNTEVNR